MTPLAALLLLESRQEDSFVVAPFERRPWLAATLAGFMVSALAGRGVGGVGGVRGVGRRLLGGARRRLLGGARRRLDGRAGRLIGQVLRRHHLAGRLEVAVARRLLERRHAEDVAAVV